VDNGWAEAYCPRRTGSSKPMDRDCGIRVVVWRRASARPGLPLPRSALPRISRPALRRSAQGRGIRNLESLLDRGLRLYMRSDYSVERVNPSRLIGAGCTDTTAIEDATGPRGSTRRPSPICAGRRCRSVQAMATSQAALDPNWTPDPRWRGKCRERNSLLCRRS
jgi:hypothetical protein